MTKKNGPLAGIRLLEIDAIGPVPLAAMLLADMGAEIVRIARPPSVAAGDWDDVGGDILHRSRVVTYLDLKQDADRERLLALIERADGLIEGYRPGVMERLGVGPDVCLARNPRFVFGRMTGWGQSGPLALRAGHDINYLSITGALHAMGERQGTPPVPLNLVGDYGGGAMFLIFGLLSALLAAQRTGRGQVVDACITDGVASLMSLFYAWQPKGLWEDAPGSNLLDGAAPFYRCYECADGRHVAVGCLEPKFFAQMVDGLGLSDRCYDQNDREGWPAMQVEFAAAFLAKSRDEWAALFAASDACVTPVLSMEEAPRHAHNEARATFVQRHGVVQPSPAPRLSLDAGAIGEPSVASAADLIAAWS
ncbi:CoA transferase [Sphingobium sp. 10 DY56-G10]|uniref:CaiB/BaiF CoA transferase family protein n=1 Tax=Sphingomonadales TaxID=204457 RepID=UPI0000D7A576|nr:CaiB/BaiF CoA-transferase family protein [Sphingomonas sp. SKA58]EAT10458.1 Alpha-methylacyl-CoA racemase [Sphingomonas sp. SKA58]